jgi:hypothetical protein
MADKLTAKQMLEYIDQWFKDHEGHYSPGDRQIQQLFKDAKIQLSRMEAYEDGTSSPGTKAASKAIDYNRRSDTPEVTQYNMKSVEPRGLENQPKTYEDAAKMFQEAHDKFMEQVGGKEKSE